MMNLQKPPSLPRMIRARRGLSTAGRTPLTIGIRQEDPTRIWERRSPLTPAAVARLISDEGVDVIVQNCERRVFPMSEFIKAGAKPHLTLERAHIVLGIKEVPLHELDSVISPLPRPTSPTLSSSPLSPSSETADREMVARTHLMFSHTAKGQAYNMPLLSRFLRPHRGRSHEQSDDLLPRLVDYELLTDDEGKRTVGFGWFAGVAGALESLSAMAQAHLQLGIASPFLHTPRPHTHPSIASLRTALRSVGDSVRNRGTPSSLGPCILVVTGSGKVAQGALSILEELPIVKISASALESIVSDPETDLRKIYLLHTHPRDYLHRKDGRPYDRADYYKNPGDYNSFFGTKIAPYSTLLLNGAGWSPSFPRLMTNSQLAEALERAKEVGKGRFGSVGDISCDVEGGLEFLTHSTSLSDPFYVSRPSSLPAHLPGVQIMAVDILPTTLPLDASSYFSMALEPYLRVLIKDYRGMQENRDELAALQRATICRRGKLSERHLWLGEEVRKWRESISAPTLPLSRVKKKRVLLLGSGMVAGPAVGELCRRQDVELILGSNSLDDARSLTKPYANAQPVFVDMADRLKVDSMISEADLVISLLPVANHPLVAELCLNHRKHLVTASYISPAMKMLHERAVASDVLLLNEIGLDPGIDHCSATSLLCTLRAQNKRVVSFTSFCGGLPSPEALGNDVVPLRYKFSWSPKAVLTAALNGAKFRLRDEDKEIDGKNILLAHFPHVPISDSVLKLEGIANRDSLSYADTYKLGGSEDLRTLLRGTLRYPGFCDLMHSFKSIGLLELDVILEVDQWTSLTRKSLEARLKRSVPADRSSLASAIGDLVSATRLSPLLDALEWLSLLPPDNPKYRPRQPPPTPRQPASALDLFSTLLASQLRYGPREHDMVVLSHEVVARSRSPFQGPLSSVEEIHTSSLVTYGEAGSSAMSRTVGLPVAFAALEVLDGRVAMRGVRRPVDEENLWRAVLNGLESLGIGVKERVRMGVGMDKHLAEGIRGIVNPY